MGEVPVHLVNQNASSRFTAQLLNTAGSAIADVDLVSITMTLVNLDDRDENGDPSVINSRDGVSVYNAGPGTYVSPDLTIELDAADNAIADGSLDIERHMMILKFVYDTDRQGVSEQMIHVKSVAKES